MNLKSINPQRILAGWVLLLLIIDIISLPLLLFNTVGGQQSPAMFLMGSIEALMYGMFIISFCGSIIFYIWFKKFWYINLIFILFSGVYIFWGPKSASGSSYSFSESTDSVGNNEIKSFVEYYNMDSGTIRSESYWKNGKKDSVWSIYSKTGGLIKRQRYSNDTLRETIK